MTHHLFTSSEQRLNDRNYNVALASNPLCCRLLKTDDAIVRAKGSAWVRHVLSVAAHIEDWEKLHAQNRVLRYRLEQANSTIYRLEAQVDLLEEQLADERFSKSFTDEQFLDS